MLSHRSLDTLEKEDPVRSPIKIGAPVLPPLKIPKALLKFFFPLPPVPTLALHEQNRHRAPAGNQSRVTLSDHTAYSRRAASYHQRCCIG